MTKPNRFILNTDYATLKNGTKTNTISATIPNNLTWDPTVTSTLASATVTVGTINAGIRAYAFSSMFSRNVIGTTALSTLRYGIPSLGITNQSIALYCTLKRIDASTVQLKLDVENVSGAPNFRTEESQTVTFVFSTFLSSFD